MPAVSYGTLVALLSFNTVAQLVSDGVVFTTLTITAATQTTPIVITVADPPVNPLGQGRPIHAVISGVTGMTEANSTWVLTQVPNEPTQFTLTAFDAQGNVVQSVGQHAYTGGGIVQIPLPDGTFLLGRRWVERGAYPACPRFVFVPTKGKAWDLQAYQGVGQVATVPPSRGGPEQQFQQLHRAIGQRFATFEVYVSGVANPPDPDGGDFDAVLYLTAALYGVLFDFLTPYGGHVLQEFWPSQLATAAATVQLGQQWMGVIECPLPLYDHPLQFAPVGTVLEFTVKPDPDPDPGDDDTTFTVT